MSWAHVSSQGKILQVVGKVGHGFRLSAGDRLIPFSWPEVDTDLIDAIPNEPVSAEATTIEFTLVQKPNASIILQNRCIAQIDRDVDQIYAAAIGNRGPEYTQAELEATNFRDAGYSGPVPPYVEYWATAKGQTPTWAADDILAQALAWRGAAAQIRETRLSAKEAVRSGDHEVAMASWNLFVASIRNALGLSS